MPNISYRRHLPHIHPDGYPLFITFRLANTLPVEILSGLKKQRESELRLTTKKSTAEMLEIEQRYFSRYDEWLDTCTTGPRWLEADQVAHIVRDKIIAMQAKHYKLIAYCLMPNHVHLLIENHVKEMAQHSGKSAKYPVTETLRLLKGNTARFCNQALARNGQFWHDESYDHVIRSEEELKRTVQYILLNPVKAGLVREWKDWKYTYVNPEYGEW